MNNISPIGMSFCEYLKSMEPAVRALFKTLDWYYTLSMPPPLVTDETGLVLWTEKHSAWFEKMKEIGNLEYANALLYGGIAQAAYVAIKEYSRNGTVENEDASNFLITNGAAAVRFCIGRRVHGIPLGLLVYAARIQHNHWEDGTPSNKVVKAVFRNLYEHHYNNPMFDLAYDLDWPIHRPVTHHVLRGEMGWRAYDNYRTDMREMLADG